MISAAERIFSELPGLWRLHRNIPGQGQIDGTVEFTAISSTRLLYQERGEFRLGTGETTEASRSYIYELQSETIVIYYNDPTRSGDILHELSFSPEADGFISHHCHVCSPDTYNLVFRFGADRCIEMMYDVKGPKKDYTLQTFLTRSPP